MFKEILQIVPKLSGRELADMERSLGRRFGNVAKKFGKGMAAALAGGGIAGAALGLIDKILNPLKETQDAIDRVLKQGDDVVTNAKQFGTTAGKLFRLQSLAKSTGLDEGALNILIEKFQGAVAEAAADKTKVTAVRQFVGDKDTAESFFQFIQSLQKMDKTQQVLVQQEIFGEKQILKMADFLQTDFVEQAKTLGGPSSERLTPGLEKLAALNDYKDALAARTQMVDVLRKSRIINEDFVKKQDEQVRLDLDRENNQIKSYKDLADINIAASSIVNIAKEGLLGLTSLVVKVTDLANTVKGLSGSRIFKGLMKMIPGGGD